MGASSKELQKKAGHHLQHYALRYDQCQSNESVECLVVLVEPEQPGVQETNYKEDIGGHQGSVDSQLYEERPDDKAGFRFHLCVALLIEIDSQASITDII